MFHGSWFPGFAYIANGNDQIPDEFDYASHCTFLTRYESNPGRIDLTLTDPSFDDRPTNRPALPPLFRRFYWPTLTVPASTGECTAASATAFPGC